MTEIRSEDIKYHPEIEVALGEEFGIISPSINTDGDFLPPDTVLTIEVLPFVLVGVGSGQLRLHELTPNYDEIGDDDCEAELPAGLTMPLFFSIWMDNLPHRHNKYLEVLMKYNSERFRGLNKIDPDELIKNPFSTMRVRQWTNFHGIVQPLYPPKHEVISEVRFSFTRDS